MKISATNHAAIAAKGVHVDNGQFTFLVSSRCGAFAIENEELSQVFVDTDMKRAYFDFVGEPPVECPSCKGLDSFEAAGDEELERIRQSEWRFVL